MVSDERIRRERMASSATIALPSRSRRGLGDRLDHRPGELAAGLAQRRARELAG
jgi:predicted ABC-type transport system involved in lysophospholipase L1 biosynthesis ATPase subunit